MKVLIVGVLHNQQTKESSADSAELRLAKNGLENLLRQTIKSHQVEFIGEESKHGVETIAKRLADQHTPKIKWACIDMTDDQERTAGIFDALQARPFETDYDDHGTLVRKYLRIPEDETRECFFVQKIKKEAETAQSILVICGHCHVEPLRERFEKKGHRVEVCYYRKS
ncbi:MAG: hypothetical protein WA876_14015 [Candidatus Acidiferrales bacterium]